MAKALSASRVASVAATGNAIRKTIIATELTVAGVRGIQGVLVADEDPVQAGAYILEALLRVYGARLLARTRVAPVDNLPFGKDLQVGEYTTMEKAHYIYRGYVRELIRKHGKKPFAIDEELVRAVGDKFNLKPAGMLRILGVYRIFQQLQKGKYEVSADDYSLIELAITRKIARDDFFCFSTTHLKMPDSGLDRFSSLCLERDAPVRNPQDFAAFCYVLSNGTSHEVSQIVEERTPPKEVKRRTRRRIEQRVFVEKLDNIKEQIERITLDDFRDTVEEIQLIRQIEKLVVKRLRPLVNGRA